MAPEAFQHIFTDTQTKCIVSKPGETSGERKEIILPVIFFFFKESVTRLWIVQRSDSSFQVNNFEHNKTLVRLQLACHMKNFL
jgi:hypothetical protein